MMSKNLTSLLDIMYAHVCYRAGAGSPGSLYAYIGTSGYFTDLSHTFSWGELCYSPTIFVGSRPRNFHDERLKRKYSDIRKLNKSPIGTCWMV